VLSTTNGTAKTSGASATVNGYLIFILYSVAVLARTLKFPHFETVLDAQPLFFSLVVRFIGSTTYMIIRMFAGE
jgi:chitin synthase